VLLDVTAEATAPPGKDMIYAYSTFERERDSSFRPTKSLFNPQ
jgi:hypothetical protein